MARYSDGHDSIPFLRFFPTPRACTAKDPELQQRIAIFADADVYSRYARTVEHSSQLNR